ncbi:MAG TPA: glucose-6-phosphate dehydrogenase [Chloroflexota bacterium]|nr:glucose-6-phosphate dehydrogenase [Chloroflexota bacterium]
MVDAARAQAASTSPTTASPAPDALDAALLAPTLHGEEPNLLREGLRRERTAPPCALVIFGASGDLTSRKLIPALYDLALQRLLPPEFAVVGVARHAYTDESFRNMLRETAEEYARTRPLRPEVWESFAAGIYYLRGDPSEPETYARLGAQLDELDRTRGTCGRRLFYIATPPTVFSAIVRELGAASLNRSEAPDGWVRIVIEKPFGRDLTTARLLNRTVQSVFRENQIFRIDHYLGKETVQNIMAFRFSNRLWEPLWSEQHIDHVQITVAESIGVEDRGGYYEQAGALRDMVQNHMLQLLTMVAMEPPVTFEAEAVRDEKLKVLRALRPISPAGFTQQVVRGQYGEGWIGGQHVPGYRQEPGVAPNSDVETYVALKLYLDTWRWAGTPFYLRHGKRLPKRSTEIVVQFKPAPHVPFGGAAALGLDPNLLVLRVQPDEGITLRFGAKVPGPVMQLRSVNMDFYYGSSFLVESPDAYERLLLDCMLGDRTLFMRADEVEQAWSFVTPIFDAWAREQPAFPNYAAGTWGPAAADQLIRRDGRHWHRP